MKVAFLLNDLQLSGGVGVVVQHARELVLRHGHDVTLVLVREQEAAPWEFDGLAHLHVEGLDDARDEHFDVAIATWWETTYSLFELEADRYVQFVQSFEDRFYERASAERPAAAMTLDLPVTFVTEARWIADTLREVRPDAPCFYVRNGIDKGVFASPERIEARLQEPLRVVVEGNPRVWFKGVYEAIGTVGEMREPHHLTVVTGDHSTIVAGTADRVVGPLSQREMAALYAESDVVFKLSRVEGMFGPPLEGFHMGATCVVAPVTGVDEYIVHGWNGMLVDWDDPSGAARTLDLLARDRRLLTFLRANALETAHSWPSWEQSATFMAAALDRIRRDPPPPPYAGARQLVADHRLSLERHRMLLHERNEYRRLAKPALRLKQTSAWQQLKRLREHRAMQPVWALLRPLTRRVRSKLTG
ncbi:glycosyltransferase family 4 protein [Conexibacter woesei]|uniref:Glycosyl transferase group 1 n=1 Tax=Conexibacter woesei (strain DSM 14684 / CCUG 47730 / CIP 108061 / JCM 11494 / NBRC 100937 / ID131577) TaxID=469383 RepID=D3EZQ2_CONWI|nr:glycosyltransferase family 4 protein [Conexibacter woesei]ADB53890.1 glycosyl transferase group 1 [Conexibacter woesei DSM 14684]